MDALDHAIIDELTRNGRLGNQELASRVGLTAAPCLRRVRRLEKEGVIVGYRAVVDPERLGRGFEVITHVELSAQGREVITGFEERVARMPEVVEFRRMFGSPDYMMHVQVRDAAAYEEWVMQRLFSDSAVARVDSRMTMKNLKSMR
ncbi:Lrp/AsnC family transcriptional regulator [Rothia sp. AR01]|uniref:Lrp/AsnC family transcriptional regulator n=1 Tax=Rothia santali TaxID=2949643 RepID=A0A9X2HAL3_9MICC|nr:Lrp/AsnC family transcriptional regulator [Rothia santali]MCP3426104.1 Lrp/AsnC family transcriptional regulator [Rothia santali]